MTDDYGTPPAPTSSFFTPSKHVGSLVLITPTHEVNGEAKPWGLVNSVYCSVFVLRGEGAGGEYSNVGISNGQLAGQLRRMIGGKALGVLAEQGRTVVLRPATAQDKETARIWEGNNPGKIEKAMAMRATPVLPQPAQQAYAGPGLPPPPPVTHVQPQYPPF